MADSEFFRLDQELWFSEFTERELPQNLGNTYAHSEIFEFDDVPV